MALPTTITGITLANQNGYHGPFISSGGNVYFVGIQTANLDPAVYKATDPASSFSEMDGANRTSTTADNSLWVAQDGDTLHVVWQTTNGAPFWRTFSMASDTWGAAATQIDTVTTLGAEAVSVAVRSDGDVIVLYQGTPDRVMGTDYERVDYARREGGSWTVGIAVDPGGSQSYSGVSVVMDGNDRAHLFYGYGTTGSLRTATLNSANSLDAGTTLTVGATAPAYRFGRGVVSGSTIYAPFYNGQTNRVQIRSATSADAPSWSGTDVSGVQPATVNDSLVACMAVDGTTLHLLYADSATSDLWRDQNSGSGWGTDVKLLGANVSQLSENGSSNFGQSASASGRGQSFTVGVPTIVQQVGVNLSKSGSPADSVRVDIVTDLTSTLPIGTGTISGSSIGTTGALIACTLDSPVTLQPSTTYYLRLRRTGAVDASNYYRSHHSSADPYSGGQAYNESTTNSWSAVTGSDIAFQLPLDVTINRVSANVYTRGSATVLAYVYLDGTTVRYNEYTLSGGTPTLSITHLPASGSLTAPTFAPGQVALSISHLVPSGSLTAPTLVSSVSLTVSHLAPSGSLTPPTLTPGTATLSIPHLAASGSLTPPTLTPGEVALSVDHLAPTGSLTAPTLESATLLSIDHLAASGSLTGPTFAPGEAALAISHLAPSGSLTAPSLDPGAVALSITHLAPSGSLTEPSLSEAGGTSPAVGAHLIANSSTAAQSSYDTASFTPTANALVLAWIATTCPSAPNTPTLTGNGLTWVLIDSQIYDTSGTQQAGYLFRAMGASPSTGALTIDFGGQAQNSIIWIVDEFTSVNTSGTNGSGAIGQTAKSTATSNTIETTLASALGTGNRIYAASTWDAAEIGTQETNWTLLGTDSESGSSHGALTQWRDADTDNSATVSHTTSGLQLQIVVEIVSATVAGPSLSITHLAPSGSLTPPTLTPGEVALTISHLAPSGSLTAPTLTAGAVTLAITHLAASGSLTSPSFVPGEVTLSITHLDASGSLTAPTLDPQAVALTITHLDASGSLTPPSLESVVSLSISHLAASGTLTEPTFAAGEVALPISHLAASGSLTAPTFVPGDVTLTITHLAPPGTLTAPSFDASATLAITHLDPSASLFTPTLDPGDVTLSVSHLAPSGSLTPPTFVPGDVTLAISHLVASGTLTEPSLDPGAVALSITHLAASATLGSVLLSGEGDLAIPHLAPSGSLTAPTFAAGDVTLSVSHLAASASLTSPTLDPGTVTLSISHLAASGSLTEPTFVPGDVTLSITHLASSATLTTPTLEAEAADTLSIGHLAASGSLTAPSFVAGDVTLAVTHLAPSAVLFAPTIDPGSVTLAIDHLAATATLTAPSLDPGLATLSIGQLAPSGTLTAPVLSPGEVTLSIVHLPPSSVLFAVGLVDILPDPIIQLPTYALLLDSNVTGATISVNNRTTVEIDADNSVTSRVLQVSEAYT